MLPAVVLNILSKVAFTYTNLPSASFMKHTAGLLSMKAQKKARSFFAWDWTSRAPLELPDIGSNVGRFAMLLKAPGRQGLSSPQTQAASVRFAILAGSPRAQLLTQEGRPHISTVTCKGLERLDESRCGRDDNQRLG